MGMTNPAPSSPTPCHSLMGHNAGVQKITSRRSRCESRRSSPPARCRGSTPQVRADRDRWVGVLAKLLVDEFDVLLEPLANCVFHLAFLTAPPRSLVER